MAKSEVPTNSFSFSSLQFVAIFSTLTLNVQQFDNRWMACRLHFIILWVIFCRPPFYFQLFGGAAGQTQCANEEELGKVEESSNKIDGGSRYNNIWIDH